MVEFRFGQIGYNFALEKEDKKDLILSYYWSIIALASLPGIAVVWIIYAIITNIYAPHMPIAIKVFETHPVLGAIILTFIFAILLIGLSSNKRYKTIREIEASYLEEDEMPQAYEGADWAKNKNALFIIFKFLSIIFAYISFIGVLKYIGRSLRMFNVSRHKAIIASIITGVLTLGIYVGGMIIGLETDRIKQNDFYDANNKIYHIIKSNVENMRDNIKSSSTDRDNVFVRDDKYVSYSFVFSDGNFLELSTHDLFENYKLSLQTRISREEFQDRGTEAFDDTILQCFEVLKGVEDYLDESFTAKNLCIGYNEELYNELLETSNTHYYKDINGKSYSYSGGISQDEYYIVITYFY